MRTLLKENIICDIYHLVPCAYAPGLVVYLFAAPSALFVLIGSALLLMLVGVLLSLTFD